MGYWHKQAEESKQDSLKRKNGKHTDYGWCLASSLKAESLWRFTGAEEGRNPNHI